MLRDIFFNDFWWKLFSLLLAGFIWVTVHKIIEAPKAATVSAANTPVTYGEVPVAIVATAADTRQFGVNSNSVSVTVSGDKDAMNVFEANQIHAVVDVTDFDPKAKDPYRRVDVSVPWGITVVDVQPAKLKVAPVPKH